MRLNHNSLNKLNNVARHSRPPGPVPARLTSFSWVDEKSRNQSCQSPNLNNSDKTFMRQINTEEITDTVEKICIDANYNLGDDLVVSLQNALNNE